MYVALGEETQEISTEAMHSVGLWFPSMKRELFEPLRLNSRVLWFPSRLDGKRQLNKAGCLHCHCLGSVQKRNAASVVGHLVAVSR